MRCFRVCSIFSTACAYQLAPILAVVVKRFCVCFVVLYYALSLWHGS